MHPTYQDFVFNQIRIIGRAWLAMNPGDHDTEQLFEKIGEMSWRALVDGKSLEKILEEIGVNPADYLPASGGGPSEDVRRTGTVHPEGRAFADDGQEGFTPK